MIEKLRFRVYPPKYLVSMLKILYVAVEVDLATVVVNVVFCCPLH